ncbi:MAG: rod shape-determining protein MreD [Clostridiales bacterium]|nr:rod shape-determining protein MreD [Clostridiales bacterium]
MPRVFVMTLMLLINFVLQSTLFQYISILSVKPNTALILIVSYSILRGDVEGAIVGFLAGLLQDLFFGSYTGLNAMLYLLIGYFCGKPFKDFYRENSLLPLGLVAASFLFYQFGVYFGNFLFRGKIDFTFYLGAIIIPGGVYTLILSIPFYSFLYAVNTRLEQYEKTRRKLF